MDRKHLALDRRVLKLSEKIPFFLKFLFDLQYELDDGLFSATKL